RLHALSNDEPIDDDEEPLRARILERRRGSLGRADLVGRHLAEERFDRRNRCLVASACRAAVRIPKRLADVTVFAIVADLGSRGLQAVEHASQHIAGILLIEPELDAAREDARETLANEPRKRVSNLAVAPRLDRHRREDVET